MPRTRRHPPTLSPDARPDQSGPRLRLRLLGPPEVTWDGQPVAIPRRQPRALLYRLASHLQPLAREQLHFLFWPDHTERAARRGLSQALYLLHEALGAAPALVITDESIALDPQITWCDTVEFARLGAAAGARDETDRIPLLRRAVDLVQGPFLAGVSFPHAPEFEAWLMQERQAWELLYLAHLETLCADAAARGETAVAIAWAQRYLATNELAEPMHRRLIELYVQSGDRPAAVRQFERCMIILDRELGTSPMPETRIAYQQVFAGQPMPAPVTADRPQPRMWPEPEVPLIGRDRVIERLHAAQVAANAGHGGIVLITGEPGIGKTRLMHDLAAHWQPGAIVIEGSGQPQAQSLPYQPIVQALRAGVRAQGAAWLQQLPVPSYWLNEAARLVPELRPDDPSRPTATPADSNDARLHLFEAVSQVVLGLSARQTLVLCLDDLHWADRATLDWLIHVARYLASNRVLIVGTVRSEELPRLADLRHTLRRQHVLTELPLEGLDRAGVRELLTHLHVDERVADAWANRLVAATGGNPFFILETVRALAEQNRHRQPELQSASGTLPLPDSVRAAVDERLQHVTPLARQVLEAGAVLGPGFAFDLLLSSAGRSEIETVDALDELVGRHLLVEQTGSYRFPHEIVQSVVYQQLSFGRRRLLHRRAGEMLEKRFVTETALLQGRIGETPTLDGPTARRRVHPDADLVSQLARHFGSSGDLSKAIVYLLQAGDLARELYAYQEAIQAYRQALEFLQEIGELEQAARTLMKLALTYHLAFDYAHAREVYDQGFELWQRAAKRPPPSMPPAPHALRINWPDPTTLDPGRVWDTYTSTVVDQLFRGLVERTTDLEIVPAVARAWEILDGGQRYVFHLRDDVYWSDGQPVTAGDFAFAWQRVLAWAHESGVSISTFSDIKNAPAIREGRADAASLGVYVIDPMTLVVELDQPTSYFLQLMACSVCYPVPRHVIEKYGDAWTQIDRLVVNGPFRPDAWVPGQCLRLVRNRDYYGRFTGNVQRIDLFTAADPAAGLASYEAGELDVLGLWNLSPAAAEGARQQHPGEYVSFPALETWFVQFDCSQAPFDDARVRRALALAVDSERLADVILPGRGVPASGGLVPPGMPQHAPGMGLPYRPGQAWRLLAEAGFGTADRFPAISGVAFAGCESFCQFISAQWRENLGIDCTWEIVEFGQLADSLAKRMPGVRITSWTADYPDPDNFLREVVRRPFGAWHHTHYDALVDDARRIADPDRRMALYGQAESILIAEASILPVMYGRQPLLLKPWVKRFPSSAIEWWFWKDVVLEEHPAATIHPNTPGA